MALKFVQHFTDAGQEVYKEVQHGRGRIDFVSVLEPVRTAVEVKLHANLAVLEQAMNNCLYCHYSYVAIPWVRGVYAGSTFNKICRRFGIGVLVYEDYPSPAVEEYVAPEFRRKVLALKLADFQKESVAGGNGGYMTEFKMTIRGIVNYAKATPGAKLSEALKHVPHHYSTAACGASSIRKWIERGVVRDFTLDNGRIIIKEEHR